MRTWVSGMAACGFHSVWKKLSAQRPEHQAEVVTPALIQDGPRLAEPKCAKRAKRYAPETAAQSSSVPRPEPEPRPPLPVPLVR